jgi:hypothetical protein
MKQALLAAAAIGIAWLLISTAPDVRRYIRMVAM